MRFIIPSIFALALGGSAHAGVTSITSAYYSVGGVAGSATPDVIGVAPDGNVVIDNSSAFFGGIGAVSGAGRELLWWSSAGPTTPLSPAPTPENDSTATSVNINLFPFNPNGYPKGFDAAESTVVFTSPSAATEQLSLSGNGDSWLFLNGKLVETHVGAGSFTASIGESLSAGTNTLQAFYFSAGAAPSFSFDPEIPAGAPATPEIGTWAMLAIGGAAMFGFARKRQSRHAIA
jgi:hypothetical protein